MVQGALDLSTLVRSQVSEARRILDSHQFSETDPRRISSTAAAMPIDHTSVPKALKFNKTPTNPCFGWGPGEHIANSQELYFGGKWNKNHVSRTFLKSPPARNL